MVCFGLFGHFLFCFVVFLFCFEFMLSLDVASLGCFVKGCCIVEECCVVFRSGQDDLLRVVV